MKTVFVSRFSKLIFSASVIALSVSLVSCKDDDDKVNCSKLEQQAIEASLEGIDAISNEDCQGIEDAYAKTIEILKKAKSCDFVQELMDDYSVSSIEELEAEFITQRDAYLEESGCNN